MNKTERRRQRQLAKKSRRLAPASGQLTGNAPDIQQALELAVQHHGAGELSKAEGIYQEILKADPNQPVALHLLGVIAYQTGNNDIAVELISKALAIEPDFAEAHNNLGLTLQDIGKLDEAIASYHKALAIQPDLTEAHINLGNALRELGQLDDAVASYDKAIALNPDYAKAHNNLGAMLKDLGRLDEAIVSCHKALAIKPDYVEAHINLGSTLKELGRLEEAIASYHKAVAIEPDHVEAHNNLGATLQILGRLDDAVFSFEKALALKSDFIEARNNLGNALAARGELDEAMANYRRALEIDPDFEPAHSNLIFTQDFLTDLDQAAQQAERKRWNDRFILPLAEKIKPHANDRDPARRLRIGYVSADFKKHSACQGFASLILYHDRDQFEVFCYDGNPTPDAMTEALRAAATSWRSTLGKSDDELAETIRKDGIDILVDLSGHTNGNRLVVFGQKPAPIQVTGLGHLAPGVSTIDYRLTTVFATPPEEADIYPEAPVYLSTFVGFLPPPDTPPVGPPPYLESGNITFGCLNRLAKISDDSLALWAKILLDVAGSRLLIKDIYLDEPVNRQRLLDFFSSLGIDGDRLVLLGRTPQREHLDAYNRIDMALDPIPHGGGITTLEGLWMGVPVLGLYDFRRITTRIIKFICQPLGLQDWVAESAGEYHKMAVEWAGKLDALADLRPGLRQRVSELYSRHSPDVENAYREMWERWCSDEPPTALYLAGDAQAAC